jgi:hypothetical protein
MCQPTSVNPARGRLRQEDCEFKASLGYSEASSQKRTGSQMIVLLSGKLLE